MGLSRPLWGSELVDIVSYSGQSWEFKDGMNNGFSEGVIEGHTILCRSSRGNPSEFIIWLDRGTKWIRFIDQQELGLNG